MPIHHIDVYVVSTRSGYVSDLLTKPAEISRQD
jgi:hypothetical protein